MNNLTVRQQKAKVKSLHNKLVKELSNDKDKQRLATLRSDISFHTLILEKMQKEWVQYTKMINLARMIKQNDNVIYQHVRNKAKAMHTQLHERIVHYTSMVNKYKNMQNAALK